MINRLVYSEDFGFGFSDSPNTKFILEVLIFGFIYFGLVKIMKILVN